MNALQVSDTAGDVVVRCPALARVFEEMGNGLRPRYRIIAMMKYRSTKPESEERHIEL